MGDPFRQLEAAYAQQKVARGEDTGPVSRLLSGISILVVVYLAVQLVRDHRYLVLVLLAAAFTRFSVWVLIGVAIYFAVTAYWMGVALLAVYFVVAWLAVWVGMRHIRHLLHSGGATVDPLEGAPDVVIAVFVLMASFASALLTHGLFSGILWALVVLIGLYLAGRLYARLGKPWRRLHFSLLYRYAGLAGRAVGLAQIKQEEFDPKPVLVALVKSAYPNIDDQEAQAIVDTAGQKLTTFADRMWLEQRFRAHGSSERVGPVMEKLAAAMHDPKEIGLFVRCVVAEIIGREYGEHERQEYIYALVTGAAD